MGRIARLISFVRTTIRGVKTNNAKVDRGGKDNRTVEHFSAPGDDSFPLEGDYLQLTDQAGTGRDSASGYLDPKNKQKATAGDKRIYARDPDSGDQVAEFWLKSDGSIMASNENGSFELKADGDFVINSVTIKADGSVIVPSSLVLSGREIDDHSHSQASDSGGDSEHDTGPNN